MDPDEALRLFRKAIAERRYSDAASTARDLILWIDIGGFKPSGLYPASDHWGDEEAEIRRWAEIRSRSRW